MQARDEIRPQATATLWHNRDYMWLWSGQVISTLGSAASTIIYPLLILALTGSPEAAGVAGALRALPYLLFSLPGGALIDRWDRKAVMIRCDIGRALAVASIPMAVAFDALSVAQIYAVTLVEGSLFVFFNLAEVAALPRVVPVAQLPHAAALNDAGFGIAHIVGPPMGTVLYQAFGRAVPFLADAITYLVSVASLLRVKAPFRIEHGPQEHNLWREVGEGLRWLWANPLIRYMALLTGGLNVINAATPLILIVLAKELGASDAQVGVVFSLSGAGAILGSLVGGRVQRRFSFGQVIIGLMAIEAVLFPLYALMPSFVWLGVVMGAYYFMSPIYNVVQFSYRLTLIPDRLQGRVNSIFRLLAFGFMPLGAALSGVALERLGSMATVALFSALLVGLAAATALNRHVRHAAPITSTASAER
ncbi:MAG TPA: MFS transporter [Usitatibacter sp.]|nr:MFS transporter [Usitatibacter sp.]